MATGASHDFEHLLVAKEQCQDRQAIIAPTPLRLTGLRESLLVARDEAGR